MHCVLLLIVLPLAPDATDQAQFKAAVDPSTTPFASFAGLFAPSGEPFRFDFCDLTLDRHGGSDTQFVFAMQSSSTASAVAHSSRADDSRTVGTTLCFRPFMVPIHGITMRATKGLVFYKAEECL